MRRPIRDYYLFGSSLHPLTRAWRDGIIAAGGSVSTSEIRAIDRFRRTVTEGGIRSLIYAFYPLVGGIQGCAVPLMRGYTDDSTAVANATNSGYVPGDYSATLGITNNGASKTFFTGIPNTFATWPDHGLFAGVSGANLASFHMLIGSRGSSGSGYCVLGYRSETDRMRASISDNDFNGTASGLKTAYGRFHFSRGANNSATIYKNGSAMVTDSTTRSAPATDAPSGLAIGAMSIETANQSADFLRGSELYAGCARHMNATQAGILDAAIAQLLADLGRPLA
jgi:hypothetical protein